MIFKTIRERHEGFFRPRVNGGRRGCFVWFGYALMPWLEAEEIEVVVGEKAPAHIRGLLANHFLAPLQTGIRAAWLEWRNRGEWIWGVRVEITDFRYHEVDTLHEGVRSRAVWFANDYLLPRTEAIRALDPVWRTPDVLGLATQIRQTHTFDALPVLADALEEVGCDHDCLLDHCRHVAVHGETCWAVAMVLGE